jgi:F-type H+-transporting ATPase subunit b
MLAPLAQISASTVALIGAPSAHVLASNGSFLIKPGIGLMVWTLLVFGLTMLLLAKLAFPPISKALERRQHSIEDSIDTAERTRTQAEEILAEYRERLKEARAQSDEIVQRARQTAESHEHEGRERGKEMLAEAAKRAERDIEAASKRALDDIRKEVANLTIMATEKVTRKTLNDSDQRRLVEEALSELDFSGLSSGTPNN